MNYLLIISIILILIWIISLIISEYYMFKLKISMAEHQLIKYQIFIIQVKMALQKNDLSIITDFDPDDEVQTSFITEIERKFELLNEINKNT